jgi:hypothetical protein
MTKLCYVAQGGYSNGRKCENNRSLGHSNAVPSVLVKGTELGLGYCASFEAVRGFGQPWVSYDPTHRIDGSCVALIVFRNGLVRPAPNNLKLARTSREKPGSIAGDGI